MENNFEKNEEINGEVICSENTEISPPSDKKPFPWWIVILGAIGLALIAVVVAIILILPNKDNNSIDYTVTVLNELGNPVSDVIVKFTGNDGGTSLKVTNSEGKAILAEAPKGDYTVLLESGPSGALIIDAVHELTAEMTDITAYVHDADGAVTLSGEVAEGTYGLSVSLGSYAVYTRKTHMSYLVFKPTQSGIYKFAITDSGTNATIGNYGYSSDTYLSHTGGIDYDGISFSLIAYGDDISYVIGIDNPLGGIVNVDITRTANAPVELSGPAIEETALAASVGVGTHTVEGTAGNKSYIVFSSSQKGVYKVSFTSTDSEMTVGYYGIPLFVLPEHPSDIETDGKSFELTVRDTNTPSVIGLNFTIDTTAELTIERIGDPPFDPLYTPWTDVQATKPVEQCTLSSAVILEDFDITDPFISVSLGDDGYYYTSEGKLLYLRIGSVPSEKYFESSLAEMAGLINTNNGSNMGALPVGGTIGGSVYDENGNFVGNFRYNQLLESYYEKCDEATGVYPLNEELLEVIKVHGDNNGWWDYLFGDTIVNRNNVVFFLCCTVK